MPKNLLLLIVFFLCLCSHSYGQVTRDYKTVTLLTDQSIANTDTIETAWIPIGGEQFFSVYGSVKTDSSFWVLLGGDSINFDIKYALGYASKPSATSDGYWKLGSSAFELLDTFNTSDTTNGASGENADFYKSLSGVLSPAQYIKFYIMPNQTTHLKGSPVKNITLDFGLFKQP